MRLELKRNAVFDAHAAAVGDGRVVQHLRHREERFLPGADFAAGSAAAHACLEGVEDDDLDVVLEDGIEELGFRREVDDQRGALSGERRGFVVVMPGTTCQRLSHCNDQSRRQPR